MPLECILAVVFSRERTGAHSDTSRPTAAGPPCHVCTHMAGTAAESADCKRVFTKCKDKSAEIFRNAKTKCRTSATNAKTNCRSCATNAKINRGGVAAPPGQIPEMGKAVLPNAMGMNSCAVQKRTPGRRVTCLCVGMRSTIFRSLRRGVWLRFTSMGSKLGPS